MRTIMGAGVGMCFIKGGRDTRLLLLVLLVMMMKEPGRSRRANQKADQSGSSRRSAFGSSGRLSKASDFTPPTNTTTSFTPLQSQLFWLLVSFGKTQTLNNTPSHLQPLWC